MATGERRVTRGVRRERGEWKERGDRRETRRRGEWRYEREDREMERREEREEAGAGGERDERRVCVQDYM